MQTVSRRRFLTIVACAGAMGTRALAALGISQWQSKALGARVTLSLAHPDASGIADRVFAELRRLERIFSLYLPESPVSILNKDGQLSAPPFELLDCLGLCGRIHTASKGRFDPTVQPLWAAYVDRTGHDQADQRKINRAKALVGWDGVKYNSREIRFDQPGMAITLNGIAQGYIADRLAHLMTRMGLNDVMVDTGELRAIGGHPDGGDWPVILQSVKGQRIAEVGLRDAALATSAPTGTFVDAMNQVGHILDPTSGLPTRAPWRLVSVAGPSAALADGLSTAICLINDHDAINALLSEFSDMSLMHLS